MANMLGSERLLNKHPAPRSEPMYAGRHTGLPRGAAWTPGHKRQSRLASFPTAGVCCPIEPRPPATADNIVVAPDPPKTPTSSAWQTPLRGIESRGRNGARHDRLDFSAYCTSHVRCASEPVPPACADTPCLCCHI